MLLGDMAMCLPATYKSLFTGCLHDGSPSHDFSAFSDIESTHTSQILEVKIFHGSIMVREHHLLCRSGVL